MRGRALARRGRARPWRATRFGLVLATAAAAMASGNMAAGAQTAARTAPPSAIGDEAVVWIAVSPAYQRTGLVIAQGTLLHNCQSNCSRFWVSHDGGNTWSSVAAAGGPGLRPVIAVTGAGHEVLLGQGDKGVERSDDGGQTWQSVGSGGGMPAPEPSFARDGAIAVAGSKDYALTGSNVQPVTGSGGLVTDSSFAFSPSFPQSSPKVPAALLAGIDPPTKLPVVQRCSASLACTGSVRLSGGSNLSGPPALYPSTTFDRDGTVFAQTETGISKSTDGGASFTPMQLGAASASQTASPMMALAPGYSETGSVRTVYASIFQVVSGPGKTTQTQGGIYRSTDGGGSWGRVGSPGPFDGGALGVAVAPDGRLFGGYLDSASGGGGLLCSADQGATWHVACPAVGGGGAALPASGGNQHAQDGGCAGACSGATAAATAGSGDNVAGGATPAARGTGAASALAGAAGVGTGGSRAGWLLPLLVAVLLVVATVGLIARRRKQEQQ